MADIHVLAGDGNWHWQVAIHIAVPNEINDVSVPYQTALANSGLGGTSVMPTGDGAGHITTTELAQMAAGEVYEEVADFPISSGGQTPAEIRAALLEFCAALEPAVLADLQSRLRYFGHTESED